MLSNNPPRWLWKYTIYVITLIWLSIALVNVLKTLNGFILIVLMSFLTACALEQPVNYLQKKGMRRSLATLLTLFMVLASLISIILLGGAVVISQITSLKKTAPDIAAEIASWAGSFGYNIDTESVSNQVTNWIANTLQQNASGLLTSTGLITANIAVAALIIYYLVAEGPKIRRNICSLLPQKKQQRVLDVWVAAIDKAGGYFISRAILAVLATISSYIFFIAAGVQYAIALAVWVGVISQLIPAVGTYLASALPIIVAVQNGPSTIVYVIIFLLVYQQIENYFIAPKISNRVMQIHPAIAFVSAIIGAIISGIIGALIAIPLVATVQAAISASLERHELIENELLKQPVKVTRRKRKPKNG